MEAGCGGADAAAGCWLHVHGTAFTGRREEQDVFASTSIFWNDQSRPADAWTEKGRRGMDDSRQPVPTVASCTVGTQEITYQHAAMPSISFCTGMQVFVCMYVSRLSGSVLFASYFIQAVCVGHPSPFTTHSSVQCSTTRANTLTHSSQPARTSHPISSYALTCARPSTHRIARHTSPISPGRSSYPVSPADHIASELATPPLTSMSTVSSSTSLPPPPLIVSCSPLSQHNQRDRQQTDTPAPAPAPAPVAKYRTRRNSHACAPAACT